ncbi:MAG: molybdenum cofactor guanylyltransferase [Polyangiales bacterium]
MSDATRVGTVVGILVGGRSSRMGGAPKGLLPAPDTGEPLVVRTARLAQAVGLRVALVGDTGPYVKSISNTPAYAKIMAEIVDISDHARNLGPLSGLAPLLAYGSVCDAIVLSCDLPHLTARLIERLATTRHAGDVLAPKRGEAAPWEPLCARWSATDRVRAAIDDGLARGDGSLQRVLAKLDVTRLSMSDDELRALVDWDTPGDVESR